MPWLLACSALAGFVIGLRYRAAAAIAASAVAAIVAVVIGAGSGFGAAGTLALTVGTVVSLQGGYVVGALLSSSRSGDDH